MARIAEMQIRLSDILAGLTDDQLVALAARDRPVPERTAPVPPGRLTVTVQVVPLTEAEWDQIAACLEIALAQRNNCTI